MGFRIERLPWNWNHDQEMCCGQVDDQSDIRGWKKKFEYEYSCWNYAHYTFEVFLECILLIDCNQLDYRIIWRFHRKNMSVFNGRNKNVFLKRMHQIPGEGSFKLLYHIQFRKDSLLQSIIFGDSVRLKWVSRRNINFKPNVEVVSRRTRLSSLEGEFWSTLISLDVGTEREEQAECKYSGNLIMRRSSGISPAGI